MDQNFTRCQRITTCWAYPVGLSMHIMHACLGSTEDNFQTNIVEFKKEEVCIKFGSAFGYQVKIIEMSLGALDFSVTRSLE